MNKKQLFLFICIFETVILAVAAIFVIRDIKNNTTIESSIENWKSKFIEYDNGWQVNEHIVHVDEGKEPVNIIHGPCINLPKGTYSINIEYECDFDQSCVAFSESKDSFFIKTGTAILSKNKKEISYKIEAVKNIKDFSVAVKYNGKGWMNIKNISIIKNSLGSRRCFVSFLLFFVFVDICILLRKWIVANKRLITLIGGISFLVSLPVFIEGIGFGHDLNFHLMRIEAIVEGMNLREWKFPVKLSNLWIDGYGYPTPIYYGDLLLYIPAFFRKMGFTISMSYKIYICFINVSSTIIAYICFKKIFQNENIAILTCLAYMTSPYRMINVWVRAAVGEYSAMMFFPIIALAIYRIYTDNIYEWKKYKNNAFILALGMTGLIGTHILSTEIAVCVLFLVCIALFKKTFRINTIRVYLIAVIQTLILNLYFIVPFIDYYLNVPVKANSLMSGERASYIQERGAYILQYFSIFPRAYSSSTGNIKDGMGLTPGLVLIVVLILAIAYWFNKNINKEIRFYIIFSIIMLYISSNLFPWNYISNYKFGNLLSQIEFPWRYIGEALVFLTLLLGSFMKLLSNENQLVVNKIYSSITIGCIITSLWFIGNYYENVEIKHFYEAEELSTFSVGDVAGEYVRLGSDINNVTNDIVSENMQEVSLLSRNGSKMELYCIGSEEKGNIEIPVFNYKGYHVYDENGMEYAIEDGKNNVIKFFLPEEFSGNITVDYKEPWYWRIAEIISVISIIILFFKNKNKDISK